MSEDTAQTGAQPGRDYRETVFLPETPFPMRAGLPQKEPRDPAAVGGGDAVRGAAPPAPGGGAPLFVLHDGPPYANGAIHIGHALNKILKDFVVRSRFALGYDVDYRPGWDCHGLPIEWKIEEQVRASGRRKDEVPTAEFRERCRAYAPNGSTSRRSSSSAWACWATGTAATPPWISPPRPPSWPSSTRC
jgi:isoleucyl-tRNA synthetase